MKLRPVHSTCVVTITLVEAALAHNTRPRLDRENPSTGHVWCPRSGNSDDVILEITKNRLVFYLAFCLLGSERRVEWFDVGHVAG